MKIYIDLSGVGKKGYSTIIDYFKLDIASRYIGKVDVICFENYEGKKRIIDNKIIADFIFKGYIEVIEKYRREELSEIEDACGNAIVQFFEQNTNVKDLVILKKLVECEKIIYNFTREEIDKQEVFCDRIYSFYENWNLYFNNSDEKLDYDRYFDEENIINADSGVERFLKEKRECTLLIIDSNYMKDSVRLLSEYREVSKHLCILDDGKNFNNIKTHIKLEENCVEWFVQLDFYSVIKLINSIQEKRCINSLECIKLLEV